MSSSPSELAPCSGTKLTFDPKCPVLTASHSGFPVSSSVYMSSILPIL